MRPLVGIALFAALSVGGCSLLFNGKDLHGRSGGGDDMAVGGSGGDGGTDGDLGAGGSGGSGGGGGSASCTPKSTFNFTLSHPAVAASDPYYIALADIDGDGHADIVTSNYGENTFSVLLGDGQGGFTLAAPTPIQTCTSPLEIAVADLNSDATPDLVITCFDGTTSAIDVHLNHSTPGTVSFAAPKPLSNLPSTGKYFFPAIGKFGGSGAHPGLVLVGNNQIYIFYGNGDGTFPTGGPTFMSGMGADAAAVSDINGDGLDDIVSYNDDDNDMMLAVSSPTGYMLTRLAYNLTDMGDSGGQVYFGGTPIFVDFDHDGLKDIVIASGTSEPGDIYMFKNGGTTTAPSFPVFAKQIDVGDEPLVVAMADFNCDGTLDIVSSSNGCQSGQGCSGGPELWVLPGHGTGFDPRQTTTIDPYCDSFAIADFNGDGYPDIACGGGSNNPKAINLLLSGP
ncbi:MAG TPA: VCBS repeat-containing protein [Polyangia bacterium]|jgi:hypothetical protein